MDYVYRIKLKTEMPEKAKDQTRGNKRAALHYSKSESKLKIYAKRSKLREVNSPNEPLSIPGKKLKTRSPHTTIPSPNPQAGGPPLIGCPRLLIQYIRSYPPYLEAVSSIRNLRTRHAVVIGTHNSWTIANYSTENTLSRVILKPIWTYGIQLWGTASNSNIEILQRYQSKTLRSIVTAP
ncbi:hypothetical protein ANN_24878 [Periplaneta americana]|uniref:Uncharacterized protein n=1 Tax=Periplaneta americana TaxID=6978 RepID=A0ABQ8S0D2_PERAM|nr:hypothetical protein ANN_24878 [Periplaneta americana]